MMRALILLVSVALILCAGCGNTRHSIAFSGGYKDYQGAIEYTFDPQKTEKNGTPTLTGKDAAGKAINSAYVLFDKDVAAIAQMLGLTGKQAGAKVATVPRAGIVPGPGIIELLEKIRAHQKGR